MSQGPGRLMRALLEHVTRLPGEATTVELQRRTGARLNAVRRALVALERRGGVVAFPGKPRRWAAVQGKRWKKKRRYRMGEWEVWRQLDLPFNGGKLNVLPYGGLQPPGKARRAKARAASPTP